MKKLLFAIPLFISLSSQASLIQAVSDSDDPIVLNESCRIRNANTASSMHKFGCTLISTLSLPTIVIASNELDPESEEIWLEVLAETVGDDDVHPVSQEIADYLGKDISEIQAAVLERYASE